MNLRNRLAGGLLLWAIALVGCSPKEENVSAPPAKGVETIADANNRFAFELYGKLRSHEGNLFYSPYSIFSALTMTYAGAAGETSTEMADTLEIAPLGGRVHSDQAELLKRLNSTDANRPYQLAIANRLWSRADDPLLDSFKQVVERNYQAAPEVLDFGDAEAARATINEWTAQRTFGKIKEAVPPGTLDGETGLVLVNAIYFKGDWAEEFDAENTLPGSFYLTGGEKIEVPMMYVNWSFPFAHVKYNGEWQLKIVAIPYKSDELSLVVLLPDERDGLADLEKHLAAASVERWLSQMEKVRVRLSLPKFKLSAGFQLKETLQQMGMSRAFVPSDAGPAGADFSGMNGDRKLFLSAVVHQAVIDVNEKGTEAAAETVPVPAPTPVEPEEPALFQADHPFVFLIRDNRSESILFMGRITNPNAANSPARQ